MFKKLGVLAVVLGLCFSSVPCFAGAQNYDFYKQVDLTIGVKEAVVNRAPVTMDQAAYVSDGRALVPFRFLGESLGATVSWDAATQQAMLVLSDSKVVVTVGSVDGNVNGKVVKMDVPAVNKDGRLFIPLRFVSENLGAVVEYNPDTKGIQMIRVDMSKWVTYEAPNNLNYMHPAGWTIAPNKDDENTIEVKTPNGSILSTYYSDEVPGDLLEGFKKAYGESGWTLDATVLDDESDADYGYEIVFSHKDKGGKIEYAHVFVDAYETGSNVGESIASEEVDEVDAMILYMITSS